MRHNRRKIVQESTNFGVIKSTLTENRMYRPRLTSPHNHDIVQQVLRSTIWLC